MLLLFFCFFNVDNYKLLSAKIVILNILFTENMKEKNKGIILPILSEIFVD
jgi:hypothetical protein